MRDTRRLQHVEEMTALNKIVVRLKAEQADRVQRHQREKDPEASVLVFEDNHDPDIPF